MSEELKSILDTNLHSILVLLKAFPVCMYQTCLLYLHSILVLLKVTDIAIHHSGTIVFTFYSSSIKGMAAYNAFEKCSYI